MVIALLAIGGLVVNGMLFRQMAAGNTGSTWTLGKGLAIWSIPVLSGGIWWLWHLDLGDGEGTRRAQGGYGLRLLRLIGSNVWRTLALALFAAVPTYNLLAGWENRQGPALSAELDATYRDLISAVTKDPEVSRTLASARSASLEQFQDLVGSTTVRPPILPLSTAVRPGLSDMNIHANALFADPRLLPKGEAPRTVVLTTVVVGGGWSGPLHTSHTLLIAIVIDVSRGPQEMVVSGMKGFLDTDTYQKSSLRGDAGSARSTARYDSLKQWLWEQALGAG